MQTTLSHHLQSQQEVMDSIYTEAYQATDAVQQGHKYLVHTKTYYASGPRYWVFWLLIVLSLLLLAADWWYS
jgi:hypothetical protein